MNDLDEFIFEPTGIFGKGDELEFREKFFRMKLAFRENDLSEDYWAIANFYGMNGHPAEARQYLEKILLVSHSPAKHAEALLALGQASEQMSDHQAAIGYYSRAMALEPENKRTMYLINNNLAYLMNFQENYSEAESYCQTAIQIDPQRHNAYKNLAVALEGQGKILEAAQNFLRAAQLNAMDPRALNLLQILYKEYAELIGDIPDIEVQIAECAKEVHLIEEFRKKYPDR